jgi:hypothetical protein
VRRAPQSAHGPRTISTAPAPQPQAAATVARRGMLPKHRAAELAVSPGPERGQSAAGGPIQLMPDWKRRLLAAAKWGAVGAAGAGALMLGGAALGIGGLAAGAATLGTGIVAGGLYGYLGSGGPGKTDKPSTAPLKPPRDPAAVRMKRAAERQKARNERGPFETGQYDHNVGIVGISGINRQRIAQTNKANYGGETFGSFPDYRDVRANLDYPGAHRAIYDPDFKPPSGLTHKQRIATGLGAALSNVSEDYRAPGIGKFIRAAARRHDSDPSLEHPLDPAINPAVGPKGPELSRQLMTGVGLTEAQKDAFDGYASDSSDEEEDHFPTRTRMLRKRSSD